MGRQTSAVKDPFLRIMGGARNLPLWGCCSVCEDIKFVPTDDLTNLDQQQQTLKYLFNRHFAKVHLRKAAAKLPSEGRRQVLNKTNH